MEPVHQVNARPLLTLQTAGNTVFRRDAVAETVLSKVVCRPVDGQQNTPLIFVALQTVRRVASPVTATLLLKKPVLHS